jgi:hypothetical protein
MQVPIACTLDAAGRLERGDEWRAFHREAVVERDRVSSERLRLRLAPDLETAVARAVDLARREKACCGFFEFSLEILADETWLHVVVPQAASGILDDFAVSTR